MRNFSAAPFSERQLRTAFSAFPSGVTALCALQDGRPVGIAASSFTSVSLNPPLVSVCVAHTSTTWPDLRLIGRIGVSVLAHDQAHLARRLASTGLDRFESVRWMPTESGAVVLEGASIWLDTTLEAELPAGDHNIALLRVCGISSFAHRDPVVFHHGELRPLAGGTSPAMTSVDRWPN
jgi:flavin reductase (DIM6/NTAB) family NADH-FMN oxidoreductase RutF